MYYQMELYSLWKVKFADPGHPYSSQDHFCSPSIGAQTVPTPERSGCGKHDYVLCHILTELQCVGLSLKTIWKPVQKCHYKSSDSCHSILPCGFSHTGSFLSAIHSAVYNLQSPDGLESPNVWWRGKAFLLRHKEYEISFPGQLICPQLYQCSTSAWNSFLYLSAAQTDFVLHWLLPCSFKLLLSVFYGFVLIKLLVLCVGL